MVRSVRGREEKHLVKGEPVSNTIDFELFELIREGGKRKEGRRKLEGG